MTVTLVAERPSRFHTCNMKYRQKNRHLKSGKISDLSLITKHWGQWKVIAPEAVEWLPWACRDPPFATTVVDNLGELGRFLKTFLIYCRICSVEENLLCRCSMCRGPWYCGEECQAEHWPLHRLVYNDIPSLSLSMVVLFKAQCYLLGAVHILRQPK